jgi:hypothetical protein
MAALVRYGKFLQSLYALELSALVVFLLVAGELRWSE